MAPGAYTVFITREIVCNLNNGFKHMDWCRTYVRHGPAEVFWYNATPSASTVFAVAFVTMFIMLNVQFFTYRSWIVTGLMVASLCELSSYPNTI
jgi:hypothetical protein